MMPAIGRGAGEWDAIILGGGHNGLVAAGYLSEAGLRVLVVERTGRLGGPVATLEFMPGYFSTISNSPGSLEPKIVRDLELERHGLRFIRPDPTLVNPLTDGRLYIGWRDPKRNAEQIESFAPGEAKRYDGFFAYLQDFANRLGISLFEPPPDLQRLVRNLTSPADQEAFARIFFGSARDLMNEFDLAPETMALIAPLAVVGGQVAPSTPGALINLMIGRSHWPRCGRRPGTIRGACRCAVRPACRMAAWARSSAPWLTVCALGGAWCASTPVARILTRNGAVHGIAAENGEEIRAPIVIAALNPRTTIVDLLQDDEDWAELRGRMARRTMRGRAFKIVLALDGMPHFAAARDEAEAQRLAAAQFRIAPDIDYLEEAHGDMIQGRLSTKPVIWGLCPSMTSPELAPPGRHVLSLNIGNSPYHLREGDWAGSRDIWARRCIAKLSEYMPDLPDRILDYRCIDPTQFEQEFGLVEANITHGDALPWNMFWMRPLPGLHAYSTPTRGLSQREWHMAGQLCLRHFRSQCEPSGAARPACRRAATFADRVIVRSDRHSASHRAGVWR